MSTPVIPPQAELNRTKSSSFLSVYANNVVLEVTPWDFKFYFGEIDRVEGPKLYIEDKVRVVLSPQQTKALLQILQSNMAEYEAKIGKIDLGAAAPIIKEAGKDK